MIEYLFFKFQIFLFLGKLSNPLQDLEHAFESAGRKTDLIEYAPQERVLSRFACMLATSNNGRAWTDFDLASYCDSCADKVFNKNLLLFFFLIILLQTYLCPHKFAEAQTIVRIPDGSKYIRISRPVLKYNESLIRYVFDNARFDKKYLFYTEM